MENKYYKQSVQRLDFLNQEKIDNMKKNGILTLGQLSNSKKSFLDKIFTELQLLDLGIAKNTLQSK